MVFFAIGFAMGFMVLFAMGLCIMVLLLKTEFDGRILRKSARQVLAFYRLKIGKLG